MVLQALLQDLLTNILFDKGGQGFSIISVNKKYRDEFNHKWVDMVILFIFAILATNYRLAKEGETPWESQEKRVYTLPD